MFRDSLIGLVLYLVRHVQIFSTLLLFAVAAEPSTVEYALPDMLACMDISDDSRRLDCYDEVLDRKSKTANSEARDDHAPTLDDPPEVAVESLGGDATRVEVDGKESFGLPERVAPLATEADEQQEPDEFIALVTSVSRRARGGHVVTLDNGQIWAEEFSSRYFPVKAGDTVTIKKRRFSGYRLVVQSGKGFAVERLR